MPEFDFNFDKHFEKFREHFFFDQYSYADLKKQIAHFVFLYSNNPDRFIGLQFQSSFLQMAAMIAAMHSKKISVLISSLETPVSIDHLKSQVAFKKIYSDKDADFSTDNSEAFSLHTPNLDDQVIIVFSSGSSNAPKGIALTFGNIYYSAIGFQEFFKQTENDVSLMNLPHHHVGGLMTLWRSYFSGGKLTSNSSEKFDFISVVPLQLARDLKNETKLQLLKSCRVILVGGAKFSQELRTEAEELLENKLKLFETYGMSETTSLVCLNGIVLPYRQVHLSSDGFFLVKGKTLSPGYYRDQKFSSLDLDKDGYFKTNDKGRLTADGKFQFSHRADLIFVSGGENINPLSVEDSVRNYPGIKDAYLVSVPDEKWGEMGILLYESESKINPDDIKEFLKSKLHPHHIPKKFYSVTLSLKGLLKPKRSELKKIAEELYLKEIFSYQLTKNSHTTNFLVIFHGFTGCIEDFNFLREEFKQTHSILAIDLPGHGQTKTDVFFSTADVLKKLAALIKLFSETPALYGYSMGGRVALQLSLHYLNPKILILESAGPGLITNDECKERLKKDLAMFDSFTSAKAFLTAWYKNELFKTYSESIGFQEDISRKSTHNLMEWKNSQHTLSQGLFPLQTETSEALKKVSFPVIYLYGSEDIKYKNYRDLYPQSFEIEGASHNPHKTHPEEITAILRKTLK